MHRYNPNTSLTTSSANAGHLQGGDRESSLSGSDTTYTNYAADNHEDVEDDPHLALTSQTLNPDGTPKRPMNAFMIFARRRRPQISAENQMMRTGEISKILSKEWTSMDMKDKKFYLDQAKKLKDSFNSKYPDYVYRRRPNNTRRKRKSDADQASPTEGGDDDASYEETSPVEGEYSLEQAGGYYQRSHNSSSSSGGYEHDSVVAQQATSSYPYPPSYHAHLSHQPSRTQGLPGPIDTSLPAPSLTTVRMPGMNDPTTSPHGYAYNPYQPHASSPVSPSQSQSVQGAWDSSRVSGRPDQGRSSWSSLPALDTSMSRQRSNAELNAMSARSDVFSPQVPHRPWSSSASSTASSSSGGASGTHPHLNSPFPTLASSFQPAFSSDQRNADVLPSPTSLSGGASDFLSATSRGMPSTGRHGTQEHASFSQSQTLPPPTPSTYPTTNQWNPQYSRSGTNYDQRQPPPMSTYPLSHSATNASPPPSASGPASYMHQWDRKYEGR